MKITDLRLDTKNANKGTVRGADLLKQSLLKHGAGRSIVLDKHGNVIAGNKTVQTAMELGLEDVIIVETDGKKLVAVKRNDMDLEDTSTGARELAYADNRVGELDLQWDIDQILEDLESGIDLSGLFADVELEALELGEDAIIGGEGERELEEKYVRKIVTPEYIPTGEKPDISDLYDDTKTKALIEKIDAATDITEEERQFLRIAAYRHTVLNFKLIAEYYAHADIPLQDLMEENALVIIDFDKALANGFIRLTKTVQRIVGEEYGDTME